MVQRNGRVVSSVHSALSLLLIVELCLSFSEESPTIATLLSLHVLLNSSWFFAELANSPIFAASLNQPCCKPVSEIHPHSNSRTGPAELRALPQNLLLLLLSHFQCLWTRLYFCISLRQVLKLPVPNTLPKYI